MEIVKSRHLNLPPLPELLPVGLMASYSDTSIDELLRSDDDDDIMVLYEHIPTKTSQSLNKGKEVFPLDLSSSRIDSSKKHHEKVSQTTDKRDIQIRADLFKARSYNILQNQQNNNWKAGPEDQNSYWKMKYEKLVEERKGFLKSLSELLDCQFCQRRLPFNAERIQCCSNGHVICDTCSTHACYCGASYRLKGSGHLICDTCSTRTCLCGASYRLIGSSER